MSLPTFETFEADQTARGATTVLKREWKPAAQVDTHTHPFRASALVVAGEFWLTVGDKTRHLQVGDTFELDAGIEHSERYGPQGATFWVGRHQEKTDPS